MTRKHFLDCNINDNKTKIWKHMNNFKRFNSKQYIGTLINFLVKLCWYFIVTYSYFTIILYCNFSRLVCHCAKYCWNQTLKKSLCSLLKAEPICLNKSFKYSWNSCLLIYFLKELRMHFLGSIHIIVPSDTTM